MRLGRQGSACERHDVSRWDLGRSLRVAEVGEALWECLCPSRLLSTGSAICFVNLVLSFII